MTTSPSESRDELLTAYLAEEIRAQIARRRIKQREICELLHMSQAGVSAKVNGRTPISLPELVTLAGRLEIAPGVLLQAAADRLPAAENDGSPRPTVSAEGSSEVVRHQGLEPRTR